MTDHIKREAAVQADPLRKELAQQAEAAAHATRTAQLPIPQSIERVRTMLSLYDLAFNKAWDFEDVEQDVDEGLELLTTKDAECWAFTWGKAAEEAKELFVLACEHLVERKRELERCERVSQEAWDKVYERSRTIREEWVDSSEEDN